MIRGSPRGRASSARVNAGCVTSAIDARPELLDGRELIRRVGHDRLADEPPNLVEGSLACFGDGRRPQRSSSAASMVGPVSVAASIRCTVPMTGSLL